MPEVLAHPHPAVPAAVASQCRWKDPKLAQSAFGTVEQMGAGSAAGAVGEAGAETGAGAGVVWAAVPGGRALTVVAVAAAASAAAGGAERPVVGPDLGPAVACPGPGPHRSRSTGGPAMSSGWKWQEGKERKKLFKS